jgi:type II secretory pathway pseudopilin PulG
MKTRRRVRALTLIEVVASLALLATAVATLLAAQGRSLEQLRTARELETAATLARELITEQRLDPSPPLTDSEGLFASHSDWRWSRTVKPLAETGDSALQTITLAIYRKDALGVERVVTSYVWLEKPHDRLH